MNESVIGWTAAGSLGGLALACGLYMQGGRKHKWIRRFLGSLVLASTVILSSIVMGIFDWWMMAVYPCLAFGFSLGYGGDDFAEKFWRRLSFALGVTSAGLTMALILGGNAWWVLAPHLGIAVWTVFLGIKNPLHAAAEEAFVCGVLNIMLCAYPFIR